MLKSKNLLSKIFLSMLIVSGSSVYCAQANPEASANQTAQDYILLDAASASLKAIPTANAQVLEEELPLIKDLLKKFAVDYTVALNDATAKNKQDILEVLDIMANEDLSEKPFVEALKTKLEINSNLDLIKFLANPDNPDMIDPNQLINKLMYAAYDNKVDQIKLLLSLGANPSFKGQHGFTALRWAQDREMQDTINLLKPITKL